MKVLLSVLWEGVVGEVVCGEVWIMCESLYSELRGQHWIEERISFRWQMRAVFLQRMFVAFRGILCVFEIPL